MPPHHPARRRAPSPSRSEHSPRSRWRHWEECEWHHGRASHLAGNRLQNACLAAITIRDVPEATREEVAARAARSGRSLQEFLLAELNNIARRPDPVDLMARARERVRRTGTVIGADEILATATPTAGESRGRRLVGRRRGTARPRPDGRLGPIDHHVPPYRPLAWRTWALDNVSMDDAWYVALAEAVEAVEAVEVPLATLDRRVAGAPRTTCDFLVPPS